MMAEMCIRVTEDDEIVEPISKKESHLMENIESNRALHRAFSVFIFNAENRLLLQQRSMDKITFPGYWTNTCCSHPLWKEDELNGRVGVCVAAVRKLDQEMGITSVKVSDFTYLCRILYKAPSDGIWGEHEGNLYNILNLALL
jgi:isopentenyl-diphosphate Delta-isomerase